MKNSKVKNLQPLKIKLGKIVFIYFHKDGLTNAKIVISQDIKKSLTNTEINIICIKLNGDDGDIFILVHELAHYIDRNSTPMIIANEYDFLAEVFAFYMEKQLELWVDNEKYKNLVKTRKTNRMYYECQMLSAIEYVLYCEEIYKKTGEIKESVLSMEKMKAVMKYDYDLSFVNYLLRYPLANIFSTYLTDNHFMGIDKEIVEQCYRINLYDLLGEYAKSNTLKLKRV